MKYSRLLSITISIGILLSVCAIAEKSATNGEANPATASSTASPTPVSGAVHDVPITGFVKHSPGICVPSSTIESSKIAKRINHPTVMSWFFAQLVSQNADNNAYIQYAITDQSGIPSVWHSINTPNMNESTSNLFTTIFDVSKGILLRSRDDGEVEINGTDTKDNKVHEWQSDSNQANPSGNKDDGDVTWTQIY
jgi:hypothetical protein